MLMKMMLLPSSRRQLRSGPQKIQQQLPQQTTAAAVWRFSALRGADHAGLTALNGQFCFQGLGFRAWGEGEGGKKKKTPYVARRHWSI
jgi:hypothetical protein